MEMRNAAAGKTIKAHRSRHNKKNVLVVSTILLHPQCAFANMHIRTHATIYLRVADFRFSNYPPITCLQIYVNSHVIVARGNGVGVLWRNPKAASVRAVILWLLLLLRRND